jgi:hypothetical protein
VYRLAGTGPDGSGVIAKRRSPGAVLSDRAVYEHVLPRAPVTSPRYYGCVEEEPWSWLFIEDVGEVAYSLHEQRYRVAGARWLATFHAAARDPADRIRWGRLEASDYLGRLERVRDGVLRLAVSGGVRGGDATALDAIAADCSVAETHWSEVEEACECMPSTLVHGDFSERNVRVRARAGRVELMPFDWDTVAWGVPAGDLVEVGDPPLTVDVDAYWSAAREASPELDLGALRRLVQVAPTLRVVSLLSWTLGSLAGPPTAATMRLFGFYAVHLRAAIRAAGWSEGRRSRLG